MGAPLSEDETTHTLDLNDTDPSAAPVDAGHGPNDSYAFLPADLPNRDAVADVFRGMKEAQGEAWAPTPVFGASSGGADFAAYQARHAPPPRHEPPPAPATAVLLNETQPLLAFVPRPPTPPAALSLPAALPRVTSHDAETTQLDFSTIVERAAARERTENVSLGATTTRRRRTPSKVPQRLGPIVWLVAIAVGLPLSVWLIHMLVSSTDSDASTSTSAARPVASAVIVAPTNSATASALEALPTASSPAVPASSPSLRAPDLSSAQAPLPMPVAPVPASPRGAQATASAVPAAPTTGRTRARPTSTISPPALTAPKTDPPSKNDFTL